MTKLSLTACSRSWNCLSFNDDQTSQILGPETGKPLRELISDPNDLRELQEMVARLQQATSRGKRNAFETLNLVFKASSIDAACTADRTPLEGMAFASPIRSIHTCGTTELSCFAQISLISDDGHTFQIEALEYSRTHRENLLRQQFGSWLLEDHLDQAVIATDMNGTICFWNRFASKLYQWEPEEAIGGNVMNIIASKLTQQQGVDIMEKLAVGEHWSGEFVCSKKDGTQFMAHVTDTPIQDASGSLKFIVGISFDFSEQRDLMDRMANLNTELEREVEIRTRELMEGQDKLKIVGTMLEQNNVGVLITERDCKILWLNNACKKLLRLRDDEDYQGEMSWALPITPEEDKTFVQQFLLSSLETSSYVCSTLVVSADRRYEGEEPLFLELGVQMVLESDKVVISMRDLTAERAAEKAVIAAANAAASSKSKTQLVQMLSHELRTPLQGIMGTTSTTLVDMTPEDGEMYESLSSILASSRLLLTLINNILDLGKIESSKLEEVELSPVAAAKCVRDSVQFCMPFAKVNDVTFLLEGDVGDLRVHANRLRLEQVLVNLFSNAIKYSPSGSNIFVSVSVVSVEAVIEEASNAPASTVKSKSKAVTEACVSSTNECFVLRIRDCGKGVPEAQFPLLFGHFVQLDNAKEYDRQYENGGKLAGQSSGSGLGLNLVTQFMARMKGHIWCNNATEGGAVFSISLPVIHETQSHDTTQSAPVRMAEQDRAKSDRGFSQDDASFFRVLLLDDSLINLKVLERMISRLGVKHLKRFDNGFDALHYIQEDCPRDELPNLIFSDIQMPEMDGYEFMTQYRSLMLPAAKCIACSADWTSEAEHLCSKAGFDGMLRKPIDLNDLRDFMARTADEMGR